MTQQQKTILKSNSILGISFSTLIVVLGFVINQSKWQEKVDLHIIDYSKQVLKIEKHAENKTLHMPTTEKIVMFVPRTEIEKELKAINEKVNNQDKKLDAILNLLYKIK